MTNWAARRVSQASATKQWERALVRTGVPTSTPFADFRETLCIYLHGGRSETGTNRLAVAGHKVSPWKHWQPGLTVQSLSTALHALGAQGAGNTRLQQRDSYASDTNGNTLQPSLYVPPQLH